MSKANPEENIVDWNNPEEVARYRREYAREWAKKYPEKVRANHQRWIDSNPVFAKERLAENMKNYFEKNREAHLAKMREYAKANREKINAAARRRREKLKAEEQAFKRENSNG